jgi:hypothetical protein
MANGREPKTADLNDCIHSFIRANALRKVQILVNKIILHSFFIHGHQLQRIGLGSWVIMALGNLKNPQKIDRINKIYTYNMYI